MTKTPHKKIINVDFDGVLHSYTSGWTRVDEAADPPNAGAIEWLRSMLNDDRFEIAIYSSRSSNPAGIYAMAAWLREHGLSDELIAKLSFPTAKGPAFVTIDDRAIPFTGVWPSPDYVAGFKPWTSRDPAVGASGEYPNGCLSPDDRGALQFAVGIGQYDEGVLVQIDFGTPITRLVMAPELARECAESLLKSATNAVRATADLQLRRWTRETPRTPE